MRGDGDGWSTCALGHRHWGRYGAAGLLLRHVSAEGSSVLLQHRALWSHHGGTWGLPGGARDSDESPEQAALREAAEEAGLAPEGIRVRGFSRSDHGGWSYDTVVADVPSRPEPVPQAESLAMAWVAEPEVAERPLHPGFAGSWPGLVAERRTLVIDTANVVGARADGWWRDRLGATRRLVEQVAALNGTVRAVPDGGGSPATAQQRGAAPQRGDPERDGQPTGQRWVAVAAVVLVLEGQAAQLARPDRPAGFGWPVQLVAATPGSVGDDTVVAEASNRPEALVVSADRGLRRRLPAGVGVLGPSWLLAQLDG